MSSTPNGAPAATPGGNNNNNKDSRKGRQRNRHCNKAKVTRFEGEIPELKEHVHDVGAGRNSAEDFHHTTTKIAEYISRMKDGAGEFLLALDPKKLEFDPLVKPVFPHDPTVT
jgi:hypothetical protein